MKRLLRLQRFGVAVSAGLLLGGVGLAMSGPAIAQGTLQLRLPDIGAPGNRESGSTRSTTCITPAENLVALMPQSNYGLTQSAYPTFYFYLPPTTAEQVKFVLLNEATNDLVYEGRFRVQDSAGIASVSLPDNGIQQPLAVGAAYVWYVSVVCDPTDPSADVVTEGQIARVAAQVDTADPEMTELPAQFAAAGLWFDALAAAAALKQGDRPADWNALLNAVELSEFRTAALLTSTSQGAAPAPIAVPQ